jgi:hypothetical protein
MSIGMNVISFHEAKEVLAQKHYRAFARKIVACLAALERRDPGAAKKMLKEAEEIHALINRG